MKTALIAIGNSKGIRLPKVLLKESGITNRVEIKVLDNGLLVVPIQDVDLSETARLSEGLLSKDWAKPEEDAAWANL